ncbi:hypothetical protein SAMN05660836_00807 [Thermodesulforhabdus norvegica]|uniref:Uncharacterized protein n=2 Tax=Thermodesulforhabdus norvegica TaxID=39841 RepID=A0A1I4S7N2_9BACT|nr:hypothetical protein SAMN05660836_00807 [Thermodesulforhabdus norvegica]
MRALKKDEYTRLNPISSFAEEMAIIKAWIQEYKTKKAHQEQGYACSVATAVNRPLGCGMMNDEFRWFIASSSLQPPKPPFSHQTLNPLPTGAKAEEERVFILTTGTGEGVGTTRFPRCEF